MRKALNNLPRKNFLSIAYNEGVIRIAFKWQLEKHYINPNEYYYSSKISYYPVLQRKPPIVYSLFATCRIHQINLYEWLKNVLETMHLSTTRDITELLPQNWKKI